MKTTMNENCTYLDPCGYDSCQMCTESIGRRDPCAVVIDHRSLKASQSYYPSGLPNYGEAVKQAETGFTTPSARKDAYGYVPACVGSGDPFPQKGGSLRYAIEVKQKRRIATRVIKKKGLVRPDLVLGPEMKEMGLKNVESDGLRLGDKGVGLGSVSMDPLDLPPPNRSDNKFGSLDPEESLDCKNSKKLGAKAAALVKYFNQELGLEGDAKKIGYVRCGGLRPAVRQCYPPELSVLQELSLKTSQKVERSCCGVCEPRFDSKVGEWKWKMFAPVEVEADHLEKYKKMFRGNVPSNWNRKKYPYIPNGAATLEKQCALGGNWNREVFAEECRPVLVFSSGKPRIVTCYSSYNSSVLSPLHHSLYSLLSRRGWLLKGDPTSERVGLLNGSGEFLSFDYIGATDNIKKEYIQAGIEILIEQAEGLSDDEIRCLRVLGDLKLWEMCVQRKPGTEGPDCDFSRGQPMGSFMSFPLLCLANKAIVDLALTDLLEDKKITFKEWTEHRCLINGDDLLLREPRADTDLASRIVYHGGQVGMETNMDKCLKSQNLAEVNSTLFENGVHVKKTNAKALYMKADVEDVLGLARDATTTLKGFGACVRANLGILKKQKDKLLWKLPYPYQRFCRKDKKILKALQYRPVNQRPPPENFLPVVPKPDGYDLFPSEELEILTRVVDKLRDGVVEKRKEELRKKMDLANENKERKEAGLKPWPKPDTKIRVVREPISWRRLIKRKKQNTKEMVLEVLANEYFLEKRDLLVESGICNSTFTYDSKLSRIEQLSRSMKEGKPSPARVISPPCQSSFDLKDHLETVVKTVPGVYLSERKFQYFPKQKYTDK